MDEVKISEAMTKVLRFSKEELADLSDMERCVVFQSTAAMIQNLITMKTIAISSAKLLERS
jgi:hypothetical protein